MNQCRYSLWKIPWVVTFAGVLVLSGCVKSQPKMDDASEYASVVTTYDPGTLFPDAGTFAWVPNQPRLPDFPKFKRIPLDTRVRSSLAAAFAKRGFRLDERSNPAFWVSYRIAVAGGLSDSVINQAYGPGISRLPGSKVYPEGALVVDVVDPDSRQPVWRGSYQTRLVPENPEQEVQERLDRAALILLARFPPRPK